MSTGPNVIGQMKGVYVNELLEKTIRDLGPIRAYRTIDGKLMLDQTLCTEGQMVQAASKRWKQLKRIEWGMSALDAKIKNRLL